MSSTVDDDESVPEMLSPPRSPSPVAPLQASPGSSPVLHTSTPPPYIPSFLPPFPGDDTTQVVEPSPMVVEEPVHRVEARLSPPPMPSSTSVDYQQTIRYDQSSLASVAEWHLPPAAARQESSHGASSSHATLIRAFKHTIDNPSTFSSSSNPSRHEMAMSLLQETAEANTTPDTLFAFSCPSDPRISAPYPAHPMVSEDSADLPLPPVETRPLRGDGPSCTSTTFSRPLVVPLSEHLIPVRLPTVISSFND